MSSLTSVIEGTVQLFGKWTQQMFRISICQTRDCEMLRFLMINRVKAAEFREQVRTGEAAAQSSCVNVLCLEQQILSHSFLLLLSLLLLLS